MITEALCNNHETAESTNINIANLILNLNDKSESCSNRTRRIRDLDHHHHIIRQSSSLRLFHLEKSISK